MVNRPQVQYNVDLQPLTTLRLPGVARRFIQAESRDQLLNTLVMQGALSQPLLILGGGSNLILTADFEGLCLRVCSRGIESQPLSDTHVRVAVQAGEPWHDFVEHCVQQGWFGLENLALIPGTVGAAPIQNIGAYGVEVKDFIDYVEVWDCKLQLLTHLSNRECCFGYRDSLFKSGESGRYVVVSVAFDLPLHFSPKLAYGGLADQVADVNCLSARDLFDTVVGVRREKLPNPFELANAGSFFKNPVIPQAHYDQLKQQYPSLAAYPDAMGMKLAAGWLIDAAGWKGYREGAVGVHERQALVLVNYGGADGEQLLSLAKRIQHDVQQRYAVALEIEPRVV
ncbi:MAG: UDP-N-acetylmuramate dehydrogenase [Motiliproteus sp.]